MATATTSKAGADGQRFVHYDIGWKGYQTNVIITPASMIHTEVAGNYLEQQRGPAVQV